MTIASVFSVTILIFVGISATKSDTPPFTNRSDIQSSSLRGATNLGQNGERAMHNMADCPKLSTDCNFDCLAIGNNGCIICTCTNKESSMSLTGGASLASSGKGTQTGQGLNIGGANGSLSLTNMQSPFSINTGSVGSGSSGTSGASVQTSQNSNGCPAFPNNCKASCASLDSKGCPVCACAKNTTSASSGNNNGCLPFPVNCRTDCVSLNSFGCPMCSCTSGSGTVSTSTSTNSSSIPSGKQSSSQASSNNNGCPAFPTNCRTDCVDLTSLGCPVCTCTSSGSGTSSSTGSSSGSSINGYTHAPHGPMSNNNGCPKFSSNCPAKCTSTNDYGCPICTCSASSQQQFTSGTSAPSSESGGIHVECPPLTPNCTISCLTVDKKGCIICNADCYGNHKTDGSGASLVITTTKSPVSTQKSTVVGSSGNGNSGTFSGNINGCLPFDTSCPDGCADVDQNGCLICTCAENSKNKTSGSGISNGTIDGSGSTGTISCSAFDGVHCNPACIGVDKNGCLTCDCKVDVTTPSIIVSTTKSQSVSGNGTSGVQTNSSTGTPGGITGTGNSNSCAAYDTSCPPGCTKLDALGCLSCSCSLQNGTSGASSGKTGNGNSCPAFDTKCSTDCTHIDAMGCLTCSCTGTTITPGPGTGTGTNGNANNCPAVDIMSCRPTCLKLDNNGCVSCTCAGTTPETILPTSSLPSSSSSSPSTSSSTTTTTTAAPTLTTRLQTTQTTMMPSQNCPKFDDSCTRDCIIIDTRGCLGCTCSVSTRASLTTPASITAPTTSHSPMTSRSTTQRTIIVPNTTKAPQETTPGVCPAIRCVYPCNVGVSLGADNCPVCKCRTDVTSS